VALDAGTVDLRRGSRLRDTGNYLVTSPPAVAGDTLVFGSAIGDNRAVELEYGVVRAFDARTGAQRWAWDPLPRNRPGASARRDWQAQQLHRSGGANAWSIISVDGPAGRVFVPTGAPSPDFYGGTRLGRNLYANSLVALDLETGERAWHFQFVHHDLPALGLGPQDDAGRRTPPESAARRCRRGTYSAVIRTDPRPARMMGTHPVPRHRRPRPLVSARAAPIGASRPERLSSRYV